MREGRLFLVTGARGAGKTTFCSRLVELARSEGLTVEGLLSPAVVQDGRKLGIDVEDLRSGGRRRLADASPDRDTPHGLCWDFDVSALAWGDSALAGSKPCDVLVIDELGTLEFERAQGWQAGFAAVERGDYTLAVVVVRPGLLAQARKRWPGAQVLEISGAGPGREGTDRLAREVLAGRYPRTAHPDAVHWNHKYQAREWKAHVSPRPFLVENAAVLPGSGWALDVATGLGANAGFLLQRGLKVLGIDISMVALREAKSRFPGLVAVNADLSQSHLPSATFDVVLNFFFLNRELWPVYQRAIKPGGVLIIETMTEDMLSVRPDMDPAFLLKRGELHAAFRHWEVLVYREGWIDHGGHERAVASLVARKGR